MFKKCFFITMFLMSLHAKAEIAHKDATTGKNILILHASWLNDLATQRCPKNPPVKQTTPTEACKRFENKVQTIKGLAVRIHNAAVNKAEFDKYSNNTTISITLSDETQKALTACARNLQSETCKQLFTQALAILDATEQLRER